MSFDWKRLNDLVSLSIDDSNLRAIINYGAGFTGEDRGLELSPSSKELIQLLKCEYFNQFDGKMFFSGTRGVKVDVGQLASWLVNTASQGGICDTVNGFKKYMECDQDKIIDVIVLKGIIVDDLFHVTPNMLLSPIDKTPLESGLNLRKYLGGLVSGECSALCITNNSGLRGSDYADSVRDKHKETELFWLLLGLFSNHGAPSPIGQWNLLPGYAPFSGYIDGTCYSQLDVKQPDLPEPFTIDILEKCKILYDKLTLIDDKNKGAIRTSLWRFNQAVNSHRLENKAIDLGTSIEAVLTPDSTQNQLSLQVSLIASMLVSNNLNERLELYDLIKKLYDVRSKSVHNGDASSRAKAVKGFTKKLLPHEIVYESVPVIKKIIVKLIEIGGIGIDQDSFTKFILSSGGAVK